VIAPDALNGVIKKTCGGCHSAQRKMGNLVLEGFDVAAATRDAAAVETAEKIIGKLPSGWYYMNSSGAWVQK